MTLHQPERNAEILRLHQLGQGPTAIARQFAMKPDRVREIIGRANHREKARAELVQRFGENPDIAALPDDTPIEVLCLCPGQIQAWDTRVRNLAWVPPTQVKTLGDLRKADAQLRRDSFVGPRFLRELRRFCPGNEPLWQRALDQEGEPHQYEHMSKTKNPVAHQHKLFKQAARELGCDESEEAFDKVLRKVASAPPPKSVQKRKKKPARKTG